MSGRRLVRVVLAAGVLLVSTVAISASPASADVRKGTLTFTPGKGLNTTRITMYTDQSCPADTTHGYALARGKGFPAEGQTVVSNNLNNFSNSAPFRAKMQDTMAGFAAINGTQLSGRYVITFYCVDDTNTVVYGEFTGAVTFATPKAFSAPVYVPPTTGPAPSATPTASAGSTSSSPQPQSSASPSGTAPGGQATPPQPSTSTLPGGATGGTTTTAESPQDSSSSLFRWFAYLAGGLLLVFGAVFWWTGRDRPESPEDTSSDVQDPPSGTDGADSTSVGAHANDPSA